MLNALTSVIFVPNTCVKLARELARQEYSEQAIKLKRALKLERFGFLLDLYSSFRPKPAAAIRRRREATGDAPRNKHAGNAPAAPGMKACGGRRHGVFASQLRARAAPARPVTESSTGPGTGFSPSFCAPTPLRTGPPVRGGPVIIE